MDAHAIRVLEFEKIKQQLADCAACSLGKRRARGLRPSTDTRCIAERLKETTEARETIARHGVPPFGGLTDVSGLLTKAASGSVLPGDELRLVADALRAGRLIRRHFDETEADICPRLRALAEPVHENPELEERVEQTIDEEGEVRDDASDELRSLGRRHGALHERLQSTLNAVLAREAGGTLLQERLVVQRSGRYCVPVRASAQGKFGGLIHGRSDSGATVFMEPLEAVEPGNELREIELAIDEEKRRLLQELTGEVAAIADEFASDLKTMGVLDFIFAKARLAGRMEASEPAPAEPGTFHLVRARHPLLTGEIVPNDIWIGKPFDTLVITGPNTGGKTVVLRTVGLLALMFQSGLHLPAGNGSEMAVFDDVFADIGDEQSIEQSLSTFSSHMTQIIKLLQKLRARSRQGAVNALVLLDEIGAGTDPTEGSALARAILEELQGLGVRTLATTHYNELKSFAYDAGGMENASVEFDVKTLKPTFRLLIGQPGASNAFEIAQRLGLPRLIARRARSFMDPEDALVEDVIRRMEHTQQRLHQEAGLAAEERAQLEALQRDYAERLADLNSRRQQALEAGFDEARQIVEEAEDRARAIIADLQRQPKQSKITETRRQEIAELREEVEERAAEHRTEVSPEPQTEDAEAPPTEPAFDVKAGDAVHVRTLGRDGIMLRRTGAGKALVEVGKMRVEIALENLAPPTVPIGDEHRAMAEKLQVVKSMSVAPEINLIGTTVDEATVELEKYLDDAFLAGLPSVRIIHGKGTGALRRGVHQYLRQNKHVRSFSLAEREEGGEGATIAEL